MTSISSLAGQSRHRGLLPVIPFGWKTATSAAHTYDLSTRGDDWKKRALHGLSVSLQRDIKSRTNRASAVGFFVFFFFSQKLLQLKQMDVAWKMYGVNLQCHTRKQVHLHVNLLRNHTKRKKKVLTVFSARLLPVDIAVRRRQFPVDVSAAWANLELFETNYLSWSD